MTVFKYFSIIISMFNFTYTGFKQILYIPDKMATNMKEELDIEEIVSIHEAILPSSTVEDTFTIYIKEEDVKMDNEEIKGKR